MQRGPFLLACVVGCLSVPLGCTPAAPSAAQLNVAANPDQTIEINDSTTLSAAVGDRTEAYSFRWEQVSGPEIEIADPVAASIDVGPFTELGDYKFRVIASAADGKFGQDFVTVIVVEEGSSPNIMVDAGPDQNVEQGSTVQLAASIDGETEGATFAWEQISGPADAAIADATSLETEVGPLDTPGEYEFRIVITSAEGDTSQDTLIISVSELGELVVDAGEDQTIPEQLTITLEAMIVVGDASGVTFEWTQVAGAPANIALPTEAATPVGPFDAPGAFVFEVTATPLAGDPVTDQVTITVEATDDTLDPDSIIVRINAPSRSPLNSNGALTASLPPDDLEATYEWELISGEATIEDVTLRETRIAINGTADASVRVTMRIAELGRAYTDEVTIEAAPEGEFRVVITGPTNAVQGEEIALEGGFANASPGATVESSWFLVQGGASIESSGRLATVKPITSGEVRFRLDSTDLNNGDSSSDEYILVVAPITEVPVQAIVENLAVVGEPTTLTASGDFFANEDLNFNWRVVSGDASIEGFTTPEPMVTANSIGTAELELTVNGLIENLVRTGSKTVFVTSVIDLSPRVEFIVEDFGTISLDLDGEAAPITVANFLHYIDDGFYDGMVWHRVIEDFIIQTGDFVLLDDSPVAVDPEAKRDTIPNESPNGRSNLRGTISMALLPSNPESGTGGVFINLTDNNVFLDDMMHTVFGEVVDDGMAVVDAIAVVETDSGDAPIEPVLITVARRVDQGG